MADTIRPPAIWDSMCNDCGVGSSSVRSWGLLVPAGKTGNFCLVCWPKRQADGESGKKPRPFKFEK